jgi:hypothetical protein
MSAMTPNEYFYWLQGYFEIHGGDVPPLSDAQIERIVRHDRLVSAAGNVRGEQMIKIGVVLDLMRSGDVDRAKGTESVRRMVAQQFQHVIDPQAGDADQQQILNNIHGVTATSGPFIMGGVDPKTGAVYRC